jgi:hypothetical protein
MRYESARVPMVFEQAVKEAGHPVSIVLVGITGKYCTVEVYESSSAATVLYRDYRYYHYGCHYFRTTELLRRTIAHDGSGPASRRDGRGTRGPWGHGLTRAESQEGDIDLRVTQERHPGGWGKE